MEKFMLNNDIKIFCVTAKSFPYGVLEAHQTLHSLAPYTKERKYFGISRPVNGVIVYKSAAEELVKGDLSKHGLEESVIKKGKYVCIIVHNFMENIPAIGKAFDKLTAHPDIDPNGFCIEWYLNKKDVRCMVRLDPTKLT
ncbi:MAG: hypothetical protein M0P61_12500 [Ignavibacteriaceae bacterium]|jgi:hypothetical protein|nr:hypothetical protein [Ignavibacteriaceae bacterium]